MTQTEASEVNATARLHAAIAVLAGTGAEVAAIQGKAQDTMPNGTIRPTALTYIASAAQQMMTAESFAVRDAAQALRSVILLSKKQFLTGQEQRFLAEMAA